MSSISVRHGIRELEGDFRTIQRQAPREMMKTVREGINVGRDVVTGYVMARYSHYGWHYRRSMIATMHGPTSSLSSRGLVYSGEYGPNPKHAQGRMSFENGSRNQKPHGDLAKSADLMGPALAGEAREIPGRLFWPR